MLLLWTTLVLITRTAGVPIPWPGDSWANATYELDKYVCVADDLMFRGGDIVPPTSPCHQCTCQPPNIVCELTPCEKRMDCRMLQLADQCCPQYQCECEHNGRTYYNGQKLDTQDGSSCEVCYCRGGDVVCTLIHCFTRDDCEPEVVPGSCCPKYDHCPPMENVIGNDSTTGWSPRLTTSSLPPTPSTPSSLGQPPSATARDENGLYETSVSNRYDLLGETPQSVENSSLSITYTPTETTTDVLIKTTKFAIETTTDSDHKTTTIIPIETTDSPHVNTTDIPIETITDVLDETTTNIPYKTTTDAPNVTTTEILDETTDSPRVTTTNIPVETTTDILNENTTTFQTFGETYKDFSTERPPTTYTAKDRDEDNESNLVADSTTLLDDSRQPSTVTGVEDSSLFTDTTNTLDNSTDPSRDTGEVYGEVPLRRKTPSLLSNFATEQTTLLSEGTTNSLFTKGETTSKPTDNHTQENNESSENEHDTTIRLDMDAQESVHQLDRLDIGSSESATDSTEIQNNLSLETSQDPWTDPITGPESTVSGDHYFEFGTTEYVRDAIDQPEGEKEHNTHPATEESQETTDTSDVQTTGAELTTENGPLLTTKTEKTPATESLPHGYDSGLLEADKSEEAWEHHRPTQMVTDEIQYITTINPIKDHSEGENVFSTSAKTTPSFVNGNETLTTRYNKLGETEYTTSQSKEEDLTDTPSSVHPTERSESGGVTKSDINNTTTSKGYNDGDETTRYVKLGEEVTQNGITLPTEIETSTDEIQSTASATKDVESLESEDESTANGDENASVAGEKTPSVTTEAAMETETTVNYEKEQPASLNTPSHQFQDNNSTDMPTVHALDEPTIEIAPNSFQDTSSDNSQPASEHPSTLNGTHDLPTTVFDHDNIPLPIFKLSEDMANHQMVLEIHHITPAAGNEGSTEEAMLNDDNPAEREVLSNRNQHSTDVPEQVTDINSITSTPSSNNEPAQDTQTSIGLPTEEGEHTTTARAVIESSTDSSELQGATATVPPELDVNTNNEITNLETPLKIDTSKQSNEFDGTTIEPLTESEVTKVSEDTETTSVETVTSSLTGREVEGERTTENGETIDVVKDEQTEKVSESAENHTTTKIPVVSEDVTQLTPLDKEEIGSPGSSSESTSSAETDINSSPEEYTVPSKTSAFEDLSGNERNESNTSDAVSGGGQETTQSITDLRHTDDDTTTNPIVYETNKERETTTQLPEETTDTNDKLSTTSILLDDTTEDPPSTVDTTESIPPSTSFPTSQHETSSEVEDSLVFQSNKTDLGNTDQPEHESVTEIEQHLTFESNKTKDPSNNHTMNGTTHVDFVHSLPPGWLKEDETEHYNRTDGHDGEPSTTETQEGTETSSIEPSTSHGENSSTPKINSADIDTETTPRLDNTQTAESIYAKLQREDAEELGKYDLETLQNFFRNLYIQDDHEDASS